MTREAELKEKVKDRRVKCIYCNKPIHISKFGGMNKRGMFCNDTLCLIKLIRENEEVAE